jgi:CcmD family protein
VKGYSFLLWAYNVIWLGLGAYLVFLFVRLRKVTERLDRLERRIEGRPADRSAGQ